MIVNTPVTNTQVHNQGIPRLRAQVRRGPTSEAYKRGRIKKTKNIIIVVLEG